MDYGFNTETLKQSAIKEISRFAAGAYGEDGTSLFDAMKVTSRDEETLAEYIEDGISAICVRLFDVATKGDNSIQFNVPDYDASLDDEIQKELDRYLKYNACALWLTDKNSAESERYAKRAVASLDKAHLMLKSRKAPKRS